MIVNSTGTPCNAVSASASAFCAHGGWCRWRAQVQTHLITVLLFPGVQRDLLNQLRQLQFADLCGQASRAMDSSASFADSSGVFSCSSAFFSAFGVATTSLTVSTTVVAFQRYASSFAGAFARARTVPDATARAPLPRPVVQARRCSPAALLQALPVHSFWFGCSLRTLQLASCGKHRTGGIRQRHVLRRRRCRLRWHLLR